MMTVKVLRLAVGVVALLVPTHSWAEVWNVTTVADEFDGKCDQHCSLREALSAAQNVPGQNIINLPANTYLLTLTGTNENQGLKGDLDIYSNVILMGAGMNQTIIDGQKLDRLFHIHPSGHLTLQGITIQNGDSTQSSHPCGGGILNRGELVVFNSQIQNNTAQQGGGLCNHGSGKASLTNTTLSGNVATQGDGGGIEQSGGSVELIQSIVTSNQAFSKGGGIHLSTGTVSFKFTQINRNVAKEQGGGIWVGATQTGVLETAIANNIAPVGNDCVGILVGEKGKYSVGDPRGCTVLGPAKLVVTPPTIGPIKGRPPDIGGKKGFFRGEKKKRR